VLLGEGASVAGRMLLFDALGMEWLSMPLARRTDCPVCGAATTAGAGAVTSTARLA